MKKLMILAVAAIALVACSKTFKTNTDSEGKAITLGTWANVMTKAPKTAFASTDAFDVFGFKWNAGPADQTNVFNGDDVTYNGTAWSYSPLRFWDTNFANYTFFAVFPNDQLAAEANENDYAQKGLFISNELTYDGSNEKLLVAQKKTVANASFGSDVALVFEHTGSLVDIKFKKHANIEDAVVNVTSIKLSNIQTKGKFTVASYDGNNNPVGKTVSEIAGLGWDVAETPVENAANAAAAAAPYINASGVSLAASEGVGTANAADLITNLVVMPQVLGTSTGPKVTISYTITTGTGVNAQTTTYTDKAFYFGQFDDADDTDNDDTKISKWMPGIHYTYYITINANAITFTASIDNWGTDTGYYYLCN